MGPFYPGNMKPDEPTLCFSAEAAEDLSLTAPSGATFKEVPKDTRVETANLLFTAHWSLDGNTMSVHRDFTSKIDQVMCTGRVRQQTADALKKIVDSYDNTVLYFKKKDSASAAPDGNSPEYNNGSAHYKAGQYDLAVNDFTAEIAQKPDEANAYESRADALCHAEANMTKQYRISTRTMAVWRRTMRLFSPTARGSMRVVPTSTISAARGRRSGDQTGSG